MGGGAVRTVSLLQDPQVFPPSWLTLLFQTFKSKAYGTQETLGLHEVRHTSMTASVQEPHSPGQWDAVPGRACPRRLPLPLEAVTLASGGTPRCGLFHGHTTLSLPGSMPWCPRRRPLGLPAWLPSNSRPAPWCPGRCRVVCPPVAASQRPGSCEAVDSGLRTLCQLGADQASCGCPVTLPEPPHTPGS